MTINSIFIKLLLRNKTYWTNKLNIHSKIVIKSFYKNSESSLLSSMRSINALLLESISNSLNSYSFINQVLLFSHLHNKLLSKFSLSGSVFLTSDSVSHLSSNNLIISTLNVRNLFNVCRNSSNISILYHIIFSIYINIINIFNSKLLYGFNWSSSKLPKHSHKYTVLRSPHIDKKSREQFEILTHKSLISGLNLLGSDSVNYIKNKSNSEYIEYIY